MIKLLSAFLFVFVFNLAVGQTSRMLRIDEAIQLGLENSKQMKLSQAKTLAFKAKVDQLKNTLIPNITLTSGYTRISDNISPFTVEFNGQKQILNPQILNQYTNRAGFQQAIFTGFRAIETLRQSEFLDRATQLDVEKDKNEISYNMAGLFLNLYKLQNSLKAVEENEKLSRSRLTDIQNMVKSGMALDNDVLKIDLTLTSLEVAKAEIEQNISILSFNMALMTGLPVETTFNLNAEGLFTQKQVETLDQQLVKALANRAEIKSAKERFHASEAGLKIAKGTYYPVLSASGNYYFNRPNSREFPQQDRFKDTWDLGLTFSYNLTTLYNTKSQVREARSVLNQGELQIQQLEDGVKMEVKANQSAYSLSLSKLELAKKTIVQAKENQRVLASRVKNQSALISELTEADVAMAQADINLVAAQTEIELAWYKLKKSVGN